MVQSTQHILSRIRKPRVHITFDLETGGATEKKELPFVVGVMANFSGTKAPDKSLGDRKFTSIDPETFGEYLSRVAPEASFNVKNVLADDDSTIPVSLKFKSFDDFSPTGIVEQVAPLKKLLDARNRLRDLLTRLDRSEELEALLSETLQNPDDIQRLNSDLESAGVAADAPSTAEAESTEESGETPAEEGGEE
ncbi:MAG: type VI secretion system contractile sheath small subunit [Planctomycetaceae bacterium]|nr:type VI secretion system contractile sheath small subunit [Planctomycetaceae bacterium]